MKLYSKIFLKGKIELVTGLHIGGVSSDLELAKIVTVVKDNMDFPYIPGSSLRGKIRSLLEKFYFEDDISNSQGLHIEGDIAEIFGMTSNEDESSLNIPTRVIIRDSFLINKENLEEEDILELKAENTINRKKGSAEHPRTLERVNAGNVFALNIIFNIYDNAKDYKLLDKFITGLEMLLDDYLGGNGSRGYGQVNINFDSILEKTLENYEQGTVGTPIINKSSTIKEVKKIVKEKYQIIEEELSPKVGE